TGCAGLSTSKSNSGMTPLGAQRPGVVKQLTSAVSESKLGKSVSLAFKNATKKTTHKNDPTALINGVEPTRPGDYVAIGESLEQNDDGEGARRMFHKALELEPHNLDALVALGRHFDRQGQLDRAAECYREAIKFHPKSPTAYNDLGLCYARQRRYNDAAQALERAIELEPDRVLYRNNIAMVLVAQNRVDEALVHLTDAHGPAIAHYNVGCLLGKQGRNATALEHFKVALANDPTMADAHEWIDALTAEPVTGAPEQMLAAQPPAAEAELTERATATTNSTELAPTYDPQIGLPRYRVNVANRDAEPRASEPANRLQPLPPIEGEATILR
ncbi:MAG TPA: tetratricopeptide repeat protein, partial [Pirellulales bacterium]|nr:tetratricopeptide repeat protein [Pirellulales bacterium]